MENRNQFDADRVRYAGVATLIPMQYVVRSILYGLMYIGVALSLAVILFQRREVG
jgi:hypothetical protein